MSRQTEKTFRELEAYLAKHQDELKEEEDVQRLVDRFMQEYNASILSGIQAEQSGAPTAEDWLEKAENAPSYKKRMEYIRKALALEPDNLDAMRAQIEAKCGEDQEALRERYAAVLQKADEIMARGGWFQQENIGHFWGLMETRPYMRLRLSYFEALIACGWNRAAIREGQEMLRLCEGDNLGVRYRLMHIYALLEETDAMLALHKRYEAYEETQMLLPLALAFYKTGELEGARDFLLRLHAVNPDVKKFVHHMKRRDMDFLDQRESRFGCRPFTLEELAMEFQENPAVFTVSPGFFDWADQALSAVRSEKRKSR